MCADLEADAVDRFIVRYLIPFGWTDELINNCLVLPARNNLPAKWPKIIRGFCDIINYGLRLEAAPDSRYSLYQMWLERSKEENSSWVNGTPAHVERYDYAGPNVRLANR